MSKRGARRHMKSLASPGYWPTPKKAKKWVVRSSPGPHAKDAGFPLLLLIRDVLGLATTSREAKRMISQKKILVDGKPRSDYRLQVGLVDSISIPDMNIHLRAVPDARHRLRFISTDEGDVNRKIVKVKKKLSTRGGKIQITTHDGRNFLTERGEELANVRVNDSLFIEVPTQKVIGTIPLSAGTIGLILKGREAGVLVKITKANELVEVQNLDSPELVYRVLPRNLLVVGGEVPLIKVR